MYFGGICIPLTSLAHQPFEGIVGLSAGFSQLPFQPLQREELTDGDGDENDVKTYDELNRDLTREPSDRSADEGSEREREDGEVTPRPKVDDTLDRLERELDLLQAQGSLFVHRAGSPRVFLNLSGGGDRKPKVRSANRRRNPARGTCRNPREERDLRILRGFRRKPSEPTVRGRGSLPISARHGGTARGTRSHPARSRPTHASSPSPGRRAGRLSASRAPPARALPLRPTGASLRGPAWTPRSGPRSIRRVADPRVRAGTPPRLARAGTPENPGKTLGKNAQA